MIRIAIVEDEESYTQQLQGFLRRYKRETGTEFSVDCYCDGDEIAEPYPGGYDLILMDIQMPFMDGMTAAEKIREKDRTVQIMFITNRTDYAIRGYQVDALDYVVKPITYFAFARKLERAIQRIAGNSEKTIVLTLRSGICRLKTEEIIYIESEGHNLVYHTLRGEMRVRGKMQSAEEELEGCGFFRCNKGYLVNLRHVDGIRDGMCQIHGEELLISRARRGEFMTALTRYFGEH